MQKKFFILHGHFYQPPRENPWTGIIDRQPSAYPFNDWNTRIDLECYTACTRTSVMEQDSVLKTLNCYEYLSFNFGPTLLSWMEKQGESNTIKRLVEADRISMVRNSGHGNAIAQTYSHLIMPLANEKDQYTQAIWGLQDFKRRFGRDSEGFWLSETAINNETAAILVDNGIKYVILSPYQAQSVLQNGVMTDVSGGRVDPSKPYKLSTKHGDLAVFFYDGALASGISFGDLLTSAEKLKSAINSSFDNMNADIKLVHTATDGEVYGHHKYHGNMALARMIHDVVQQNNPDFEFTNYGRFLADNPPQEECVLSLGDDGKGSSWSCAHGVGRWFRDCSCHTGGQKDWNQSWRTPLRESFDCLRDIIYETAEKEANVLVKNIWDARNDFLNVLHSNSEDAYEIFLKKHRKHELTEDEEAKIRKILESLHYTMLMYTSCGWFFSDLSGIETTQDMVYARIAYDYMADLLPPHTYDTYLNILGKAQSNINGNGQSIAERAVNDSCLTTDMLKEYIFWTVMRDNEFDSPKFPDKFHIQKIWGSSVKQRYVFHMKNHTGIDHYTAFQMIYLEGIIDRYIIWKDFVDPSSEEYDKQEFWDSDFTWNVSTLSKLPVSLKLLFIQNSVLQEINRPSINLYMDHSSFMSDAVWGLEDYLLPYEKNILVFHYATQIHRFAQNLSLNTVLSYHTDLFSREVALLKKSASSLQEIQLHLEPVARAFDSYLHKSLELQDIDMIKNAHIIYWSIKDSVYMHYIDRFRDMVYSAYNQNQYVSGSVFTLELKILMKALGFRFEK